MLTNGHTHIRHWCSSVGIGTKTTNNKQRNSLFSKHQERHKTKGYNKQTIITSCQSSLVEQPKKNKNSTNKMHRTRRKKKSLPVSHTTTHNKQETKGLTRGCSRSRKFVNETETDFPVVEVVANSHNMRSQKVSSIVIEQQCTRQLLSAK